MTDIKISDEYITNLQEKDQEGFIGAVLKSTIPDQWIDILKKETNGKLTPGYGENEEFICSFKTYAVLYKIFIISNYNIWTLNLKAISRKFTYTVRPLCLIDSVKSNDDYSDTILKSIDGKEDIHIGAHSPEDIKFMKENFLPILNSRIAANLDTFHLIKECNPVDENGNKLKPTLKEEDLEKENEFISELKQSPYADALLKLDSLKYPKSADPILSNGPIPNNFVFVEHKYGVSYSASMLGTGPSSLQQTIAHAYAEMRESLKDSTGDGIFNIRISDHVVSPDAIASYTWDIARRID